MQTSPLVSPDRVEDGHGSLGHAATLRFRCPLIELEVRISRIRPSEWFHREARAGLRTFKNCKSPSNRAKLQWNINSIGVRTLSAPSCEFGARVSARQFPISVLVRQRPVRKRDETGS